MRARRMFLSGGISMVFVSLAVPAAASALPTQASPVASAHVCATPARGFARCFSRVVTNADGNVTTNVTPSGLSPTTIKSAYNFPTSSIAGAGTTVAIVDAYNDSSAQTDLGVFSTQYGLPACTTANGCFSKVSQTGTTSYPRSNSGWSLEISLDIQWAHAIAPGARILLVEAKSASFSDLLTAERYAASHATYVSNSWGAGEFSGETTYDKYFATTGVSYFVAAGDSGLPAEYPSASPNVISVGGTTLSFTNGVFSGETGWTSGGGGCSAFEAASSAQSNFTQYSQVPCSTKRSTPDVSLDADPASGVSVYDSSYTSPGWLTVGGTSAASPMWAARSADAGFQVNASSVYGSSITFRDIVAGGNTGGCQIGFDLCSGRGSWTGQTP
jgi:subtilase family serine protease